MATMKTMKKIIALLAFVLTCGIAHAASATFTAMSNTATPIPNPERGWAGWAGSDFVNSYDGGSVTGGYNAGERLSMCNMNIGAYRGTTISSTWLTNLQSRFNSIRSAGMKCVIWIYYDFTSGGNDDTAANISSHLGQIGPVLKANADVIAYVKGGFIGAWGEWHSSQNQNSCGFNSGGTSCSTANANRLTVRNALLANIPADIHVQFRTPDDMVQWFPTALTASGAFLGSTQSRMAFHDDCQLSSGNNSGTFSANSSGWSSSSMITYANAITDHVPFGGELSESCTTPLKITCAEATSEFAARNLAWLKNSGADIDTWTNSWSSGGCTNEIANMMGYRIVFDSLTHSDNVARSATLTVSLKLKNIGWSRVFRERHVAGKLVKSGAADIPCTSTTDLRVLPAQATASKKVNVKCAIPGGATTGVYTLHLNMPDNYSSLASTRAYMVRPANVDSGGQVWNNTTGYFATGTSVTVD